MSKTDPVFVYVEDEALSRAVMEILMVRGLGYNNLTIFEDSTDFMAKMENLPEVPDVIFLDIHVQPYSGFEMLKMLRAHDRFKDVTVIALTASVMNEEVDYLRDAGFNGGIAKPIDQATFPETLQCILAGEEVWSIL